MTDFLRSAPGDAVIQAEGAFRAPVEKAWAAWTEADRLKQWFGADAADFSAMQADVRVGGAWRFDIPGDPPSWLEGEYLEVAENALLVFSWRHVAGDTATPTSQVSVSFRATEGGCIVSLRHEGIQTEGGRTGVSHGWGNSFGRLAALLEAA